jgi:hypothetical protein
VLQHHLVDGLVAVQMKDPVEQRGKIRLVGQKHDMCRSGKAGSENSADAAETYQR